MPPSPPASDAGAVPAGALPVEKYSLKYWFAWSKVASADVYSAIVKSRATALSLVTLIQPCAGMPAVGAVIAESVIDTSLTPSVGGLRFDLPETVNTLNMPYSACDLPSGAVMKHTMPYVPAGSCVSVVVDCFGLSSDGLPFTVGSPPGAAIFSKPELSLAVTAFFSAAAVVP